MIKSGAIGENYNRSKNLIFPRISIIWSTSDKTMAKERSRKVEVQVKISTVHFFFFIDYGQKEGEVFIEVVIGNLTVFLLRQSGRKYSYTNSYIISMTLISQDDHLTAGSLACLCSM